MWFSLSEGADLVHSVLVDLERGCDPLAARTLEPRPVEGTQSRFALGTQNLQGGRSSKPHPPARL